MHMRKIEVNQGRQHDGQWHCQSIWQVLRALPAETMVDGLPRALSGSKNLFQRAILYRHKKIYLCQGRLHAISWWNYMGVLAGYHQYLLQHCASVLRDSLNIRLNLWDAELHIWNHLVVCCPWCFCRRCLVVFSDNRVWLVQMLHCCYLHNMKGLQINAVLGILLQHCDMIIFTSLEYMILPIDLTSSSSPPRGNNGWRFTAGLKLS